MSPDVVCSAFISFFRLFYHFFVTIGTSKSQFSQFIMKKIATLLGLIFPTILLAQMFQSGEVTPIVPGRILVSKISVSGLPDSILQDGFGLESVCVDIEFERMNRLILTLYAPDGTMVKLTHMNGRSGADHFYSTCFGEKGKYFPFENPPYSGGYQPILPLGVVNNGQNPNRNWRLLVETLYAEDMQGDLLSWRLVFGHHPAASENTFKSSALPILSINTLGQHVLDDLKIYARLIVADQGNGQLNATTGPYNAYECPIGIEWHGASSKTFWQPSYSFETRDLAGHDVNVALLGLPAGSDWVLHGPFSDKSLVRNALTLALADRMSHDYVPRTRFCELMLNGQYMGVYTLLEKIKRDVQRVSIPAPSGADPLDESISGGYIIKVDRKDAPGWYSEFRPEGGGSVYFNYVYPNADNIHPNEATYLQAYVDSFEQTLASDYFQEFHTGWRHYADENSFIDYFLNHELCKNVDAYRLSGYLVKPHGWAGQGKLKAGPLWDFNLAWRNANYANNEYPEGWTFEGEPYGVPFWWARLLQDSLYRANLACRWQELRATVWTQREIFRVIDSLTTALGAAKNRHFELYPILGRGLWPNPKPIAKTHEEEISNMKTWISRRLVWLDNMLLIACPDAPDYREPAPLLVYPNPVADFLKIYIEKPAEGAAWLRLKNLSGITVLEQNQLFFETTLHVNQLPAGVYWLEYYDESRAAFYTQKIIKI